VYSGNVSCLSPIPEDDSAENRVARAKPLRRVHAVRTPPTLIVVDVVTEELRGPMEPSEPRDESGQTPRSERVQHPETLFGYSRSSEEPTDTEDGDLDASALE
jgi:hypothetical protein